MKVFTMSDTAYNEQVSNNLIQITDILDVMVHIDGLKEIVFDLDDTLYGKKEYICSGYRKVEGLLPWVVDCEVKMWKLFKEKKPAIDELLKEGGLFTEQNKVRCLTAYRHQKPDIHLYPGVHKMLAQLKESYELGLITGGRPEG